MLLTVSSSIVRHRKPSNGAPPSEKHRASHTCGRGNKGCIHPRQLVWKTVSEASRDAVRNGQWRSGYGRGGKITPVEAAEIRALRDTKRTPEIAKMYGLSPHWIAEILRGNGHLVTYLRLLDADAHCGNYHGHWNGQSMVSGTGHPQFDLRLRP